MLSVKIEFCPLNWYSSSPTAIVLYKNLTVHVYVQSVSKQSSKAQKKKMHFT